MKQETTFALRIPEQLKDKIYKISSKKNKSINKTIIRLISESIMNEKNYFEFQYVDTGEKFSFKENEGKKDENGNEIKPKVYRYLAINKNTGGFICFDVKENKQIEFKFSENFYKPIFLI